MKPLIILVVGGRHKVSRRIARSGRPYIIVTQPGRLYPRASWVDEGGTAWFSKVPRAVR